MRFPRKKDNTLDFKAFLDLPIEQQKEAFADLKTNGTVDDKRGFQQWKLELAQAIELKKRMLVLEKEYQKLDVEIIQLKGELRSSVREVTSQLSGPIVNNTSIKNSTIPSKSINYKK